MKPSESILSPLGLASDGAWDYTDTKHVLVATLAYLDEQAAAQPVARCFKGKVIAYRPDGSWVAKGPCEWPECGRLLEDHGPEWAGSCPAPASPPSEDKPQALPEHCHVVWCQRLNGHTGACMSRPPVGERSIDECRRDAIAQNTLAEAIEQARAARSGYYSLSAQLDMWQDTTRKLEKERDEAQAELTRLKREFEDCRVEGRRQERAMVAGSEQMGRRIVESERELTRLREENARLEAWLAACKTELSEAERTIAGLKGQHQDNLDSMQRGALRMHELLKKQHAVVEAAREVSSLWRDCVARPYTSLRDALSALDQPATSPELPDSSGERPIVHGSTWRYVTGTFVWVAGCDDRSVHLTWLDTQERRAWPVEAFRKSFAHVSDPGADGADPEPPAASETPAGEPHGPR